MSVNVEAIWCVHDDSAFLALSLDSFARVENRTVYVSRTPWFGPIGDWEESVRIAESRGVKVEIGDWADESLHRRHALEAAKSNGRDFVFVVDGDEVIQAQLLDHLLKLAEADAVDAARCHMLTFFKGPNYVVQPPEKLAPLILLKCKDAEHVHIREYNAGPRVLTLSADFGVLLHLSYAGDDSRIAFKLASTSHRTEIVPGWFEEKWKAWDKDRTQVFDLHPTHPPCYHHIERIPVPPELKDAYDPRPHLGVPELPKRWPKISVVIPLHGGERIISNCLKSLAKLADLIFEVVVVDDLSPDGAAEVAESFENVTVIRNKVNLGFGGTCNVGFDNTTGEVVIFLNSDTVVPRSGLIRLIETLMSSGTVAAAGPCSNNAGYHQGVRSTYSSLDTLDLFAQDFAHREVDDADANMLVGFCLAVKRTAMEEVGLFDAESFGTGMYEDNDLCYRLLRARYRLKVSSRAFVHHEGSQSLMLGDVHPIQLLTRNREVYHRKWERDIASGYASHLSGESPDPIVFNEDRNPEKLRKRVKEADISIVMIVKNEERVIEDCIRSIKPFATQIVVVDTGSTDRTVEILERLGVEVHHFPWTKSFSEARNESLKYATGKWVLWIDADDTLTWECGEALVEEARTAPKDVAGFVVPVRFVENGPGATQVDHFKLFRNGLGIRFEFRIHEQNLSSLPKDAGSLWRSRAYVLHSGYDSTPEGQARKRERDYELLFLDLAEQGEHTFILFNLGMTDYFTGRYERAVDWLERSIVAAKGEGSHVRKAYALLTGSLRALGRFEDALRTAFAGMEEVGGDAELRFLAGCILADAGRFEEAMGQYLAMDSNNGGFFSSVNVGIFGALREHNLGVACHGLNDYPGARRWWLQALQHRPLHQPSLDALWKTAADLQDFTTLQQLLEIARSAYGEGEQWAQMACGYAYLMEGEAGPERFLNRAIGLNPQASGVRTVLVRSLMVQGRIQEAYPHLMVLTENGVAEAYDHLSTLAIRQCRYAEALKLIEQAVRLAPGHAPYAEQAEKLRDFLEAA